MSMTRNDHKDRLFQRLFGDSANKGNLLSLYNALNHTSYTNEEELEINTIEDVIYMGMNLYSRTLLKIPTPKYFVLYNGDDDKQDMMQLKLSDLFIREETDGAFEWTATMLNINYGHNADILDACQVLREYSLFVAKVKTNRASGMGVEKSVKKAVDDCIAEDILRSYFITHKAEVIGMCITEYNEAETMQAFRNEGWLEGRNEGRNEAKKAMALRLLKRGKLTIEEIAEDSELTVEEVRQLAEL